MRDEDRIIDYLAPLFSFHYGLKLKTETCRSAGPMLKLCRVALAARHVVRFDSVFFGRDKAINHAKGTTFRRIWVGEIRIGGEHQDAMVVFQIFSDRVQFFCSTESL